MNENDTMENGVHASRISTLVLHNFWRKINVYYRTELFYSRKNWLNEDKKKELLPLEKSSIIFNRKSLSHFEQTDSNPPILRTF